ncbi:MAG: hypothetical protein Q7T87_07740 [Polaromonas sp.]|nr:hypothetical protein [Polaromonas sp.]
MSSRSNPLIRRSLPLSSRMAAFLGFLAVLSALLAPVAMMARDVQTGQFGGVCSAGMALAGMSVAGDVSSDVDGASGAAGESSASAHCDLCGSPALLEPPLPVADIPCAPGNQVALADLPTDSGTAVAGLPFSRGPPAA